MLERRKRNNYSVKKGSGMTEAPIRLTITRDLIERFAATDISKLKAGDGQEWINLQIRIADAQFALKQSNKESND